MSLKHVYPEKIPEEMLKRHYIDDIILYSLGVYGPLQKAEFNNINKTTFYKYLNSLIEKGFLFPPKRKRKIAIYEITPLGQAELMKRLEKYNLDFYELIGLEKKKIRAQVSQLSYFFEKYEISDDEIKIDFLSLYNNLIRDDSLSIFSEEKFNILILYIVLNDVKYFKKGEYVLTVEEFIEKIDVDPEISLTKTDILMFIQEVVDKNRYGIKFFKLSLKRDDTFLFIGEDSEIGIIFETIIKKHLRNLNYLKSLNNSEIYVSDLEDIMKPIMFDLIKKYNIFNNEIEKEIFHLVEDFITELQIELHEKPYVKFDKIGKYFSIYSPWVGLTHPFKPLSEEDEQELKDMHTTFQRIRDKEPKNKLLSEVSNYLYDKKPELALIEVNKCLEIDSKDPETLELKSEILYDIGNFEKALENFDDAQQNKTDVENTIDKLYTNSFRTKLFLALKWYDKALDIIKKDIPSILKEDKEFSEIEFFRDNYFEIQIYKLEATIHYEQGNYNKALEAIDKDLNYVENFIGMDEDERIADSFILKSKILNKLDKYDEVYEVYMIKNALNLRSKDPKLLLKIAGLGFFSNPVKSFLALIKAIRALKVRPNNENYQEFYKDIIAISHLLLYAADSHLHISKEISKIFSNQRGGMTLIELNQKLLDSEILKSLELFVKEELTETCDLFIEKAIKRKAIELNDGIYLQNSDVMREYLKELENLRHFSLIENYYINLLNAYRNNDWKEFLKENLISKLVIEMSGDKLEEIASSLIDNLLVKKFLTETKENLIAIDIDKFEEQFGKLKDEITMEETTKFISEL